MKVLLDTCVWGGAKADIAAAGHDVIWSGDWPTDPGDEEILAIARREDRILITLDKDFGELAIVRGYPHCGIVRPAGIAARSQSPICASILDRYGAELMDGAIVTATATRVRIRSMRPRQ